MNTAGSGKQVYASKEKIEPKKVDEVKKVVEVKKEKEVEAEKKPEVDPVKQALSDLNADNDDNLIDSFINESKGQSLYEVEHKIENASVSYAI